MLQELVISRIPIDMFTGLLSHLVPFSAFIVISALVFLGVDVILEIKKRHSVVSGRERRISDRRTGERRSLVRMVHDTSVFHGQGHERRAVGLDRRRVSC